VSTALVHLAIQSTLAALTPAISNSWENVNFVPVAGTPYQKLNILLSDPDNLGYGSGPFREEGFFQVSLFYPKYAGTATVQARADLIRSTFYRGRILTSGSQKVVIQRTPTISAGRVDGDYYMVPVTVYFFSNTGV
jgi:hypothetical protein